MTTVLKLGGSVVTRKDREETVDDESLAAVADAVAGFEGSLVLVHGGGSFGHPAAAAHGLSDTDGSHDAAAVAEVHAAMTRLSDAVVDALQRRDVPALPVRPLSVAHRDARGDLSFPVEGIERLLGEGFVPVVHGDVVAHEAEGATILSGDDIVVALARALGADRVGLCSTVPGVLDAEGEVIESIDDFDAVSAALGASDQTDVTGGMAGKVQALLGLSVTAHVFGPDGVDAFLGGGTPGTEIRGQDG